MRLFISLNFDDETADDLCKLQSLLRDNGVDGNYTKPENLHMTLAFKTVLFNRDDVEYSGMIVNSFSELGELVAQRIRNEITGNKRK